MISTLIKKIMIAQGLTQKEMADLLETSVDRIKSLSSGRTKNFTIEESQILVKVVGIRAEWLITGEGDMFVEQHLPSELTVDEQILLQAYRDASVIDKKKIFADVIGGSSTTAPRVLNKPVHKGSGNQYDAQTQNFDNKSSAGQNIQGDVKIKSKGKHSQAGFNISNNEK